MNNQNPPKVQLSDLKLNRDDWSQMTDAEIFKEIEDAIFEVWVDGEEDNLDPQIMNLIYVCNMFNQIDNGGIISFVDNGSGAFFHETLEALEKIQIEIIPAILIEFRDLFTDGIVPKDMVERRDEMDLILENLEDGDALFENWDNIIYANRGAFQKKVIKSLNVN